MATLLNAGAGARGLSTLTTRSILDSVGTRLDEGRELNRYLIGLLVFLGLLGTFWGLLQTVHSISGVIDSMKTGANSSSMFEDLKSGLSAPIAGMSVSFTSSLFGLAGSLILGFLDLQAGQAQNRFYTELEDFLAGHVETNAPDRHRRHPARRRSRGRATQRGGDRQSRRGHTGPRRPYARGAAADPRVGRAAGRGSGGHASAAAPPVGSTRKAALRSWRWRADGGSNPSTTGPASSTRCRRCCSSSSSCCRCSCWRSFSCRERSPARTRRSKNSTGRSRS